MRQAGGEEKVCEAEAPLPPNSVQFQKKTVGDGRRRPRRLELLTGSLPVKFLLILKAELFRFSAIDTEYAPEPGGFVCVCFWE